MVSEPSADKATFPSATKQGGHRHHARMQAPARGKRKQPLIEPTPHQALRVLSSHRLTALCSDGSFWLSVPPEIAKLLHNCALGTSEGGPDTAQDTASHISTLSAEPALGTTNFASIRLSPEEAFFLAFTTSSLTVIDATGAVSLQGLWLICIAHKPNFIHTYVAYHHFRCKGWIPRSGLQYGTHLVLYEQHPSQVHSAACVLIVPTDPGEQPPLASKAQTPDGHNGSLSWHNVEGINRLCTRVGKSLLLLFVQKQRAGLDLSTPACLNHFAVAEHNVARWVPEANVILP